MKSKTTNVEIVDGNLPLNPQWRMISEETKGIIERLLLEKLPPFRHCPRLADFPVAGAPKAETPSEVQMDEQESFVDSIGAQQWVWRHCIIKI